MTMPIAKLDLLAGYALAFALVAVVQATVVSALAFGLLDLHVAGPRWAWSRSRSGTRRSGWRSASS